MPASEQRQSLQCEGSVRWGMWEFPYNVGAPIAKTEVFATRKLLIPFHVPEQAALYGCLQRHKNYCVFEVIDVLKPKTVEPGRDSFPNSDRLQSASWSF